MIRRPPRSTLDRSSAASDVYKRQSDNDQSGNTNNGGAPTAVPGRTGEFIVPNGMVLTLSLIHISEPTRPY